MSFKASNSIEKLRGRENFENWKTAAQSYLTINGYWSCTKSVAAEGSSEAIIEKHEKALAELTLMIEPSLYSYIAGKLNAKEAWEALNNAFADTSTCRKVYLLQQWITTKLVDCSSMEEYVNSMTTNWSRVKAVGFDIDEEVAASIMLAGLPAEYKPLIFGLESTGTKLTTDYVKNILLQGAIVENSNNQPSALFVKKKKFRKVKCFNCGGPHFANKCKKPKKGDAKNNERKQNGDIVLFTSFYADGADSTWIIDSGASAHMCNNAEKLINIRDPIKQNIIVADNKKIKVECIGDYVQKVVVNNVENTIIIKNVQCVPELCVNLLSVSQMIKNDHSVVFNKKGCVIFNKDKKLIASGTLENDLFKLDTAKNDDRAYSVKNDSVLWHRRMGHVSNIGFLNSTLKFEKTSFDCVICAEGKHSRTPFPTSASRATELLQIIHSDVCGPMSTASLGGAKYYVTFIDDFSRKISVFIIKNKSQVFDCFVKFKLLVENQLSRKIKILRSDGGLEYCNHSMKTFCELNGIVHQTSCPYSPQQNGLAERYNRTIAERARCMLFDANLTRGFWAEAVSTAVKLINSSTNASTKSVPDVMWSGKPVDYARFRVFGCKAMAKIPDQKRKKLDKKSTECIFVGYADEQKGYRLFVKATKKIIVSRDVIFFENSRSDSEKISNNIIDYPILVSERDKHLGDDELSGEESVGNSSLNSSAASENENNIAEASTSSVDEHNSTVINNRNNDELNDSVVSNPDMSINNTLNATVIASPVDDHRADPSYHGQAGDNSGTRMNTRSLAQSLNPLNLFHSHYAFCSGLTSNEALSGPESKNWQKAMSDEIDSLNENRTWCLVDLPKGKKAIKCKWVFKRKTDAVGNVIRYKARLVGKGCSQTAGIDYNEIYSPVVRYASIRFLISIAAEYDLEIYQMDAVTAFLQGELNEEVFMEQPEYFNDGTGRVCALKKSIYGLKQASRVWNIKLSNVLITAGYVRSKLDPCIFFKLIDSRKIFIAIYVDDVLYFTNCNQLKNELHFILTSNFKMKDLGVAEFCVGLHITRDRSNGTIYIDQSKYIEELLEKFNMTDCKPVDTPCDSNQRLTKDMQSNDFDSSEIPYQQAVGSILYLTQGSRPDIAYAVNYVSRFNNCFSKPHWLAVKRILRYLKGTANLKLAFRRSFESLHGFCDADWASDVENRKSCTGYVFLRSNGPVSWNSKQQPTVALSTAEAEYMSLSAATQEAMWLKQLEDEIFKSNQPIKILCDNQSAISLAENNGYSARCKHIDIRHHYVRQMVNDKNCIIKYVNTEENAADLFTKALPKQKFEHCRKMFGLI